MAPKQEYSPFKPFKQNAFYDWSAIYYREELRVETNDEEPQELDFSHGGN